MPLYHEIDLSDTDVAKKIHEHLSYSQTIDAFCIWCGKESVFEAYEYDQSAWKYPEPTKGRR